MWTKNFIKELVLKNDLIYLTLCFPYLVSLTLKPEGFGPFLTLIALFGVLIFAWVMSCKKRYIFNTPIKVLFPISCVLFSMQFFENETLNMTVNFLSIVFVAILFCLIIFYTYSLHQNAAEYYAGEYHPELEDTYRENAYCRSIYSIMSLNNTIEYQYDKNIDAYLYYGKLYENISHLRFGFHIQHGGKGEISWLHEYLAYLHTHGLCSNKMNSDELAVFRMYNI